MAHIQYLPLTQECHPDSAIVLVSNELATIPVRVHINRDLLGSPDARVLILSNGAVDLARSQGSPVFQRATWSPELPYHVINICDPGTIGPSALSLSWGQWNREHWLIPFMSEVAVKLSNLVGVVAAQNRTYFGSSAGGFLSAQLGLLDSGSNTVVNNCQVDWTRWMAPAVKQVVQSRYTGMNPNEVRRRYPERTNFLKAAELSNVRLKLDYWTNIASDHDRLVDLPQFARFVSKRPELASNVTIYPYFDAHRGHNPLPREATLDILTGAIRSNSFAADILECTLHFEERSVGKSILELDRLIDRGEQLRRNLQAPSYGMAGVKQSHYDRWVTNAAAG